MRALLHLRVLDESLNDWERYQQLSLEDINQDG